MFINEQEKDTDLEPLVFNEILEQEVVEEEQKEEVEEDQKEEVVEKDDDIYNVVNTEILKDTSNIVENFCYVIECVYEYFKPSILWLRTWYNENIKVKSE